MRTYSNDPIHFTDRLWEAIRNSHVRIADAFLRSGVRNDKGDYLDLSADGKISWRPLNRMEDVIDPYTTVGRIKGKPAKALKSFMNDPILFALTDTDWETFSNRFVAASKPMETTFEIVQGDTIAKYYHGDNYTNQKSVYPLNTSCMRYDFCQPYLDLYTKNIGKVRMLVELDSDEKVVARALVWNFDSGEVFMDRIYGDNNSIARFQKFAVEQNWFYRTHNNYSYPSLMMVDGNSRRRNKRVTLDYVPTLFPFCDTMLWLSVEDGVLANSKTVLRGMRNLVKLRDTHGRFQRY